MAAILLAISFGLCAGYLDVAIIVFKKFCWNPEGYYRTARDFPWSVPVGHAVLMVIPGLAGGRREPAPTETRLATRGVVAVRDAGDLGGPAEVAAVRGMQPAAGRRAGPADRQRGRGPWPAPAAAAVRPGWRSSACWVSWRSSRRVGRRSVNTARWPDCRRRRRVPATSC